MPKSNLKIPALSRLRQFKQGDDIGEFLEGHMRQIVKAIEGSYVNQDAPIDWTSAINAAVSSGTSVTTVEKTSGSGNITIPAGKLVFGLGCGGGGGGGSGGSDQGAGGVASGGTGGGGSVPYVFLFYNSAQTTYAYSIGTGGAGGTAVNVANNGHDGSKGSSTTFGSYVFEGGNGGFGGLGRQYILSNGIPLGTITSGASSVSTIAGFLLSAGGNSTYGSNGSNGQSSVYATGGAGASSLGGGGGGAGRLVGGSGGGSLNGGFPSAPANALDNSGAGGGGGGYGNISAPGANGGSGYLIIYY